MTPCSFYGTRLQAIKMDIICPCSEPSFRFALWLLQEYSDDAVSNGSEGEPQDGYPDSDDYQDEDQDNYSDDDFENLLKM